MDQNEFGRRTAYLRQQRSLSQAALGALTGMNPTTITRIEKGQQSVSLSQAYAIAEALETTLPRLLDEEERRRRQRRIEIVIDGDDADDEGRVRDLMDKIAAQVEDGFTSGFDSNTESSYRYDVTDTYEKGI